MDDAPQTEATSVQRHKDAVLAPLRRLRDLGGNWHAAAALLEQSVHALFSDPPEPQGELTPHDDGPMTPIPVNLAASTPAPVAAGVGVAP